MENNIEKCPKCGEPQYPAGVYVVAKDLTLRVPISLVFFKTYLQIRATLRYCPKCGFLAVQDIKTF